MQNTMQYSTITPLSRMVELRNDAFIDVANNFNIRIQKASALLNANARMKQAISEYSAAYDKLDAEYKQVLKAAETELIEQADLLRDNAYRHIRNICTAYNSDYAEADKQAEAKRLQALITTYNVKVTAQYNEETGSIDQFCKACEKDGINFQTLGIAEVFRTLKEQNDIVRTNLLKRNESRAFTVTEVVKNNRKSLTESMLTVIAGINALAFLQPTDDLLNLVAYINTDFDYIRTHALNTPTKGNGLADTPAEGTTEGDNTEQNTSQPTPPPSGNTDGDPLE